MLLNISGLLCLIDVSNFPMLLTFSVKYRKDLFRCILISVTCQHYASGCKINFYFHMFRKDVKDNHRGKAPSNKTPTLTGSMNMDIWVVGTSNHLFVRGSLKHNFQNKIKWSMAKLRSLWYWFILYSSFYLA